MIHTVKTGETLHQIVRDYRISIQAIINANPTVNPNVIYIDTALYTNANAIIILNVFLIIFYLLNLIMISSRIGELSNDKLLLLSIRSKDGTR
ncbi:LysM domain-containing protein [Oceanobacillus sp. FSL K6-3682]|uniref:LysM peptidoglycan-binding domain-containing protein n=1 Tax=Oceanobacillus sp. FSL K6-3682 TaxID=2921503 RepID=UPI0030DCB7F7